LDCTAGGAAGASVTVAPEPAGWGVLPAGGTCVVASAATTAAVTAVQPIFIPP